MTSERRNTFDFLRLLAALAVVVQHATIHLDARFLWVTPGNPWWLYDGVTAFFIISGYFVFRSAERLHTAAGGWADFYMNRALRIIPAIWTYVLVAVVLVLAIGVVSLSDIVSVPGLAWIASGLALAPVYNPAILNDFGVGTINGSLWTIPVEVSFYVVVPILVLVAHRLGSRRFLAITLPLAAALALAVIPLSGTLSKLYGFTFAAYLWAFAIGIAWHLLRERIPLHWVAAVVAVAGYVGVRAVNHAARDTEWIPVVADLAGTVVLSYLVMFVGFHGPMWFRAATDRVGDLSFGTYIWHMAIVNLCLYWGLDDDLPGTVTVALVIVATLVVAWLSWRFIERPALARKRRSTRPVSELQPAALPES